MRLVSTVGWFAIALVLGACRIPPSEPAKPTGGSLTGGGLSLFAQDNASFDAASVREQLNELAREAAPRLQGATGAHERVAALNRFFFEERGFAADSDLEDPDNLFPDQVIERRRGYCTSLAWVYASMADRLGLPVVGVVTPQHLFLRYDDGDERINIETLERGREIADHAYRTRYRIPESSIERGVFLRTLNADGFLSQLANNLGVLHSREDRFDRSVAAYEHALRLDPRNASAVYNLARDRMRQGQCERAIAGFAQALDLNPHDVSSLNNRGVCRVRLGDVAGAKSDFLAALEFDPNSDEARRNLSTLGADASRE